MKIASLAFDKCYSDPVFRQCYSDPKYSGGTSIAAPYVSGVLAQMKALFPPETRGTFNLPAARSLLQNNAHTNVSTSARVNAFGGFINPYGMALSLLQSGSLDSHLIDFEIVDFDDNEPNNSSLDPTAIAIRNGMAPETIDGIITNEEDVDYFQFTLDDYYDIDVALIEESHPGEILLTSSMSSTISAAQLITTFPPGWHRIIVAQDETVPRHPFNCYSLRYSGNLTAFEPDVFDDGDINTPSPGSPAWDNNEFHRRTLLELVDDPLGAQSSIGFADLNFHTIDDRDYFRVRLPPRTNTECRICSCIGAESGFCSEELVITVNPVIDLNIWLLSEDGSDLINPQNWENPSSGNDREIRIPCPYDLSERESGIQITNSNNEIAFVIDPRSSRTNYDLTVTFEYLQEANCTTEPDLPFPRGAGRIGPLIPEEPTSFVFPQVNASWECEDLPWCDPADENYSLNWLGGELVLELAYFTLERPGDIVVELVDSLGKVVTSASSSAMKKPLSNFVPRKYEARGQLTLRSKFLPAGLYFIKVGAPLPTYFLYWRGDSQK